MHADYDSADLARADILLDHLAERGDLDRLTTAITERTIGDGMVGRSFFALGTDLVDTRIDIDGREPDILE